MMPQQKSTACRTDPVTTLTTPPSALRALATRSAEVIAEHQHVSGAYLASPTFSVYQFSWFRDGAFIADAMSRAGQLDSADQFFGWCTRVIAKRAGHITQLVDRSARGEPIRRDEHLPTRYTVDGDVTGEDWWDFQLDGYGTWMFMFVEHHRRHDVGFAGCAPETRTALALCVDYLCAFWSQPCFDWWEENVDGVHVSTLASIEAGLRAVVSADLIDGDRRARASQVADDIVVLILADGCADNHLVKTIGQDERVDASLIAAFTPFHTIDATGETAVNTYRRIADDLAPDGVHRFLGDTYFGGGRWVVLAGFLGAHEARTGNADRALERLNWMYQQATPEGLLPEQVTDHSLDPTFIDEWVERWGSVATPLLWSHAMYITLADELGLLDHP
jgi:GH15 family glucan-1,4-alpha-glucosidase